MKKTTLILGSILLLAASAACMVRADDFSVQRSEVIALGKLTAAPAMIDVEGGGQKPALRAIYFDALNYEGKPTKVFAWLGIPEKRAGKLPGIVLVHGGGGTAFKEWVEKWNLRGFAAISIAVEGQIDVRARAATWKKHEWAGPQRKGIYGDSEKPLNDQWMYHAVADTILANSLLRSLPEVDADKVGIMGISWGGVITSTVIGLDTRFAFAIPTYGCGHMFDAGNQWGEALGANSVYREVWDPMHYLNRAQMPTLWLSWPGDKHFPLDSLAASYGAMPGQHMLSLIPGMGHSHLWGWKPPDSYAFAESIVSDGKPWCRQTGEQMKENAYEVVFESSKPLDRALLISTDETGFTGNRKWIESPAKLQKADGRWIATANLPEGTTACFVNVKSGDLTVSSDYMEIKKTNAMPPENQHEKHNLRN